MVPSGQGKAREKPSYGIVGEFFYLVSEIEIFTLSPGKVREFCSELTINSFQAYGKRHITHVLNSLKTMDNEAAFFDAFKFSAWKV